VQDVKDFPLGAPENGEHTNPRARARARSQGPAVSAESGTLASRAGDEKPSAGSSAAEDEAAPAPNSDLGAYGPEGSRFTVLLRLDRLRGTDYQAPLDALLKHVPDRRELLTGTGLDLFADFDAVLMATPNPRDPSVTFLAVRHHLDPAAFRGALSRGLEQSDRTLVWRKLAGRYVGERGAAGKDGGATTGRYDEKRIIVMFDPGLAILTPRAYRALLLEPPRASKTSKTGEGAAAPSAEDPDGGADAGAPPPSWSTLLGRIDAEEGLVPPSGVAMIKLVNLLTARAGGQSGMPLLDGMEVPPAASALIGMDDSPFLDLVAEFKTEAPAVHWEAAWPSLQRGLRTNPYVILGGFSTLLGRATLLREGSQVRLHLAVTRDETLRLLSLAQQLLSSRGL
jgi:hypothetical protein